MTVHLVKLCVGAASVGDLEFRAARRAAANATAGGRRVHDHVTRMRPRREAELLDGGSLYWVIKGVILARQRILGLESRTGGDGVARAAILLSPVIALTAPQPRRAFQGWRYLSVDDAPPDLPRRGRRAPSPALSLELAGAIIDDVGGAHRMEIASALHARRAFSFAAIRGKRLSGFVIGVCAGAAYDRLRAAGPCGRKEPGLVRPVKSYGVLIAMLAVAACSSFPLTKSSEAISAEQEDAINRAAELEVELSVLAEENARLASRVEALERVNQKLMDVRKRAEAAESDDAPRAVAALRDAETIAVPEPASVAAPEVDSEPKVESAEVPVQSSPRLVQPTFASTDAVFESEAGSDDIKTASVLFGVHLASYRRIESAREGWRKLQRENPDELGLLEPRIEAVNIAKKGVFLRLIGGGFSSEEKAAALCASLEPKSVYCAVTDFAGEKLSLAELSQ